MHDIEFLIYEEFGGGKQAEEAYFASAWNNNWLCGEWWLAYTVSVTEGRLARELAELV